MKRYDLFIFTLSLVLGAFLLFSHLNGAVYLWEDEARAFQLMTSGQLIYLMSRPVYSLFHTQEAVFYFVAALSFLSIIFFYVLCRVSVGRRVAAFSALVYAVYPLRIDFARTLFPNTYMEPFFILAGLFCYLGVSRRQSWWMLPAGASLASVFLVHYMGYALIAAMITGSVFLWFSKGKVFRPERILFFCLKFVLGFLAVFVPVTEILRRSFNYDYFYKMRSFYADIPLYAVKGQAADYCWGFLFRAAETWQGLSIALVVLAGTLWAVYTFFKKREVAYGFFLITNAVGAGLLFFMGFSDRHLIYDRHLVWLIPFFSLCIGTMADHWIHSSKGVWRVLAAVFFAGLIGVCFFESMQITLETFNISPITGWLNEHHVNKGSILTFWKIRESHDTEVAVLIPVGLKASTAPKNPVWHLYEKPKIMWPVVYNNYKKGVSRYILTSGIDRLYATLGEGDPMLEFVRPSASWVHPYVSSSHRSFYRSLPSSQIKLYKLSDVFSAANFMMIKSSKGQAQNLTIK